MRRIIVGYDGSPSAKRALARAADLAAPGAELTIVSVVRVLAGRGGIAYDPIEQDDTTAALAEASRELADRGLRARIIQGHGDPARLIAAQAEELEADLVVVGTEHKGLLERLLLGSVSSDVVHRAPTEVLVVP
jgi:nucleotide-binding universal stress UspA family protein